MRCPYCGVDDDRVIDSRGAEGGEAIRRRRQCRGCGQRFSTYERAEHSVILVVKRGGVTEPFQRDKVISGMQRATKNLPIDQEALRRAAARVEARVRTLGRRLIASEIIGAEVLDALRDIDHVAYMRFASVYKGFTSPDDFHRELASLEKQVPPKHGG